MILKFAGIYAGVKLIELGQEDYKIAEKAENRKEREDRLNDGCFKKCIGALLAGACALGIAFKALDN